MVQLERDLGELKWIRWEVHRRHDQGSSSEKLRILRLKLVRLGELARSLLTVVNWGTVGKSLDSVPSEAWLGALYARYISTE